MSFCKIPTLLLAVMVATVPVLPGCGPHVGGDDYNAYETRQSNSVYRATATSVRQVNINSGNSTRQSVGGLIGAVTGGVVGSTIGRGHGRTLATLGGALLGGAAGAGVGEVTGHQTGLEITVRYQNGGEEVIVQGASPSIYPGQAVRVIVGADGTRRVVPE